MLVASDHHLTVETAQGGVGGVLWWALFLD
jgi:hypothetical protein